MIAQEGVEVIYHVQQTRALVKDGRVAGLELVSREGDQIRLFGTCVDATGDAAISAGAGVPFEIGSPNSGEIQPVTLLFRMGNVDIEKLLEYIHKKDQFYKEPMLFEMDDTRRPPLLIGNGFFDWVRQEKEKGLDVGREAISIIKTPNPGEVLINSTRVRQVNALNPFEKAKQLRHFTSKRTCSFIASGKTCRALKTAMLLTMPLFWACVRPEELEGSIN